MDLKIIQCWKVFKYTEDAEKTNNVQELEDFSEEQQSVELFRVNEGLKNSRGSCILLKDVSMNHAAVQYKL